MVFKSSFNTPDGSGDSVQSQANAGDFVEFVADMDLIVVVSAFSVGYYAVLMIEPQNITTRTLGFEIWEAPR